MSLRNCIVGLISGVLLTTLPSVGQAQRSRLFVEGAGGVAVPSGSFGSYVNPGGAAGIQVGYSLTDRVAISVNGDFQHLNGSRLTGSQTITPDFDILSYMAGVRANLLPVTAFGRPNRWQLFADVGAGINAFNSATFADPATPTLNRKFDHTYFGTQGGLKVAYAPVSRVSVYATGRVNLAFVDEADTAVLSSLNPTTLKKFDSAVTWPLTAGVRINL